METLVLLHGLLDDGAMWEHQHRHLAAYARVVTPDLLAPETIGEAAGQVLAGVEGPFAVAGFSMGGYVIFEMMRRAPERISRIALIDTSARADTPERSAERRRAIERAATGAYEAVVDEALPLLVHPDRLGDDALMDALRAMASRVGPRAFTRQQKIIMSRPDSRGGLDGIRCPSLVICGRQDALTPPALSEEIAAGIPDARLVLIDECGHYAPLERPFTLTALLQQWLRYP